MVLEFIRNSAHKSQPTLLIAHPVKAVGAVSGLNLAAAPASFIATLF